jgi:predicted CXXCH cytochrome family protein
MKKTSVILATFRFLVFLISLVLSAFILMTKESFAYLPGAGFTDSPHDIRSTMDDNDAGEEGSCWLCHILKGDSAFSDDLKAHSLWNIGTNPKEFEPYNSGSAWSRTGRSALALLSTHPGSISQFCLGCHDGTLGVNNYGRTAIGNPRVVNNINRIFDTSPSKVIGGGADLSNHHPIGFDYEAVRTAGSFIAPSSFRLGSKSISDLLADGKMECTTCHSVHNTGNTGEKLLWVSDRNSSLCLSCHLM